MWIRIYEEEIWPSYEFEKFDKDSWDSFYTHLANITEKEYEMLNEFLEHREKIMTFLKDKFEKDIYAGEIFPDMYEDKINKGWKNYDLRRFGAK